MDKISIASSRPAKSPKSPASNPINTRLIGAEKDTSALAGSASSSPTSDKTFSLPLSRKVTRVPNSTLSPLGTGDSSAVDCLVFQ